MTSSMIQIHHCIVILATPPKLIVAFKNLHFSQTYFLVPNRLLASHFKKARVVGNLTRCNSALSGGIISPRARFSAKSEISAKR